MQNSFPKVITIPARPEMSGGKTIQRKKRVAAYCRVSTDEEEQLSSYEAQKTYYTDKIMCNKEWTMVGIFADEGITGASAKKTPGVSAHDSFVQAEKDRHYFDQVHLPLRTKYSRLPEVYPRSS